MKKLLPRCLCGHDWEDHHHGCVMNLDYEKHPLNLHGLMAQECEATQVNGDWLVDEPYRCYCDGYDPNSWKLFKAAWYYNYKVEKKRRTQGA